MITAWFATVAVLWLAGAAGAETPAAEPQAAEAASLEAGGAESVETAGDHDTGRKPRTAGEKVELDEVEIRGELEKPKIFFILPKAEREAETRERRIRFYPDILEPLDKDRFEEEARVLYRHGIPAE